MRYDVLSIDIGSAPRVRDVPGAHGAVVPVKPIGMFVARWNALVERVLGTEGPMRIGVVGAGAGGIETVLAMRHGVESQVEDTLRQMMTGATEVLRDAGAALVGRVVPRSNAPEPIALLC